MVEASPIRFVAADGSHWSVHEIRDHNGSGAATALIFVSDEGFRRVRTYPATWRELSPQELWELSWRT